MCLAIPARICSVSEDRSRATVEVDGVRKEISTALIDQPQPGDYVLVHVGFALNKISTEEAQATLALFVEAGLVGKSGA